MILDSSLRGPNGGTEILIAELREKALEEDDVLASEQVDFDQSAVVDCFPTTPVWKAGVFARTVGQHLEGSAAQRQRQQMPAWLRRALNPRPR